MERHVVSNSGGHGVNHKPMSYAGLALLSSMVITHKFVFTNNLSLSLFGYDDVVDVRELSVQVHLNVFTIPSSYSIELSLELNVEIHVSDMARIEWPTLCRT